MVRSCVVFKQMDKLPLNVLSLYLVHVFRLTCCLQVCGLSCHRSICASQRVDSGFYTAFPNTFLICPLLIVPNYSLPPAPVCLSCAPFLIPFSTLDSFMFFGFYRYSNLIYKSRRWKVWSSYEKKHLTFVFLGLNYLTQYGFVCLFFEILSFYL